MPWTVAAALVMLDEAASPRRRSAVRLVGAWLRFARRHLAQIRRARPRCGTVASRCALAERPQHAQGNMRGGTASRVCARGRASLVVSGQARVPSVHSLLRDRVPLLKMLFNSRIIKGSIVIGWPLDSTILSA